MRLFEFGRVFLTHMVSENGSPVLDLPITVSVFDVQRKSWWTGSSFSSTEAKLPMSFDHSLRVYVYESKTLPVGEYIAIIESTHPTYPILESQEFKVLPISVSSVVDNISKIGSTKYYYYKYTDSKQVQSFNETLHSFHSGILLTSTPQEFRFRDLRTGEVWSTPYFPSLVGALLTPYIYYVLLGGNFVFYDIRTHTPLKTAPCNYNPSGIYTQCYTTSRTFYSVYSSSQTIVKDFSDDTTVATFSGWRSVVVWEDSDYFYIISPQSYRHVELVSIHKRTNATRVESLPHGDVRPLVNSDGTLYAGLYQDRTILKCFGGTLVPVQDKHLIDLPSYVYEAWGVTGWGSDCIVYSLSYDVVTPADYTIETTTRNTLGTTPASNKQNVYPIRQLPQADFSSEIVCKFNDSNWFIEEGVHCMNSLTWNATEGYTTWRPSGLVPPWKTREYSRQYTIVLNRCVYVDGSTVYLSDKISTLEELNLIDQFEFHPIEVSTVGIRMVFELQGSAYALSWYGDLFKLDVDEYTATLVAQLPNVPIAIVQDKVVTYTQYRIYVWDSTQGTLQEMMFPQELPTPIGKFVCYNAEYFGSTLRMYILYDTQQTLYQCVLEIDLEAQVVSLLYIFQLATHVGWLSSEMPYYDVIGCTAFMWGEADTESIYIVDYTNTFSEVHTDFGGLLPRKYLRAYSYVRFGEDVYHVVTVQDGWTYNYTILVFPLDCWRGDSYSVFLTIVFAYKSWLSAKGVTVDILDIETDSVVFNYAPQGWFTLEKAGDSIGVQSFTRVQTLQKVKPLSFSNSNVHAVVMDRGVLPDANEINNVLSIAHGRGSWEGGGGGGGGTPSEEQFLVQPQVLDIEKVLQPSESYTISWDTSKHNTHKLIAALSESLPITIRRKVVPQGTLLTEDQIVQSRVEMTDNGFALYEITIENNTLNVVSLRVCGLSL